MLLPALSKQKFLKRILISAPNSEDIRWCLPVLNFISLFSKVIMRCFKIEIASTWSIISIKLANGIKPPHATVYVPWKQKLFGFLFFGGIKRRQWLEMSECINHHVKVSII